MGAAAAQGGLKGRRIKGLILHPPLPPAGSWDGACADMGLFRGGVREGSSACVPPGKGTVSCVPLCGGRDRAQGSASCRAPVLPVPVPTGRGASPPARLPASNSGGFVQWQGFACRCGKGHPGHAGFPRDNGGGRTGTPRRAPPACSAQVSPCGVGMALASSFKHVAGVKCGVPCRVPRPGQAVGTARPGGLQAGRGGPGAPTPAGWQGLERLSRDWGNPSPDPPRSRKI